MPLQAGSRSRLADGTQIKSPGNERPAYLEWIVWRAFLAMDSLVIPAWQCRNFKIDQDFLPDGKSIPLNIVPMTLADFKTFLLGGRDILPEMSKKLRILLMECREVSNHEAPAWKNEISKIVQCTMQKISGRNF